MKIKDKTVLVYDIESFPNLFTCSILNSENNKLIQSCHSCQQLFD